MHTICFWKNKHTICALFWVWVWKLKLLAASLYVHLTILIIVHLNQVTVSKETFRSGSVMQWKSLASTYLNVVFLRNARCQVWRANLYVFQLMLREACQKLRCIILLINTTSFHSKILVIHVGRPNWSNKFFDSILKRTSVFYISHRCLLRTTRYQL
jgi:hypothetical protein